LRRKQTLDVVQVRAKSYQSNYGHESPTIAGYRRIYKLRSLWTVTCYKH